MKRILALCIVLIIFVSLPLTVNAKGEEVIYNTYIYGNDKEFGDGKPISIPAVFDTKKVLYGKELSVGNLSDIRDIFCDDKYIYVCDTGNNRVLVFNTDFKFLKEIETFDNFGKSDTLASPSGIFSDGEQLLICDSGNERMLLFSVSDFTLLKVIFKPEIDILEDDSGNYIFKPMKAVFDNAGRFYVIADGVNHGIIRLNKDGKFITFIGAPTVVPDFGEILWRKIATKKQKKKMQQDVPTEYDSLVIDVDGFI